MPAMCANVAASETWPTGAETRAGEMLALGAGRQMRGSRINEST